MLVHTVPVAIFGALLMLSALAHADSDSPPPSYGARSGPMLHGELKLGLAGAIAMGLENNLNVEVERYAPVIAGFEEDSSWGAFDPELFGELIYSDVKAPNSNFLAGTQETIDRSTRGFGGFRGLVPLLGSEYRAQFDGGRATTNVEFQELSPQLTSSWSLDLSQPLLRDLIWNAPWTEVKTRRILQESSQQEFRRAVMDTVRDIEDAYWTLIALEERYRVARKSVDTARALLDQTQTQYQVGVVSRVEVTEAEAGLARREFEVIVAENNYRNQNDVLINLVLGPHLRAASSLEIEPTDRPEDYVQYDIDVETAVQVAFEHRPELAAARKEVERQTVQSKFTWNQRLPELDGVFSFGQSGLAGQGNDDSFFCGSNPTDPDCNQGGFGNTFNDYSDSPALIAGIRFGIPIPNTAARKKHQQTRMELRRAESQLRRAEQRVILEVREAARNLGASQEGIASAERSLTSADEQLRAERIRLEYGESTPFDVLQREEQFVESEVVLIEAYRAYRVSATALDRFQGTILRSHNIKIDQVRALR